MFRLFFFLPEILFLSGLYFEILRPLWKGRPTFPISRALFRTAMRLLPETTSGEQLLQASQRRLADAEQRREAARIELEAANATKEAQRLEDEATHTRLAAEADQSNLDHLLGEDPDTRH